MFHHIYINNDVDDTPLGLYADGMKMYKHAQVPVGSDFSSDWPTNDQGVVEYIQSATSYEAVASEEESTIRVTIINGASEVAGKTIEDL
ncbi:hypothetical protein [Hymenobacter cavernae]|uniref:Uncharacterized protein n=1 Tax=Hymenobacter cavernae TaxID=2044852 RepID=A0ABQ1UUD5_9BACT|nr:hypothetical protein [Hymenobacter cavernae]GGF27367.1 hypothetical protein GCM10011383_43790 [Hymenobacter cavernae]